MAKSLSTRDREYLEGDSWRCSVSNVGAHFWEGTPRRGKPGLFTCIHCGEERTFPIHPPQWKFPDTRVLKVEDLEDGITTA